MTTRTSQLVEFLGSEFQSFRPCHIVSLIKVGPYNNLKATNVEINEPRRFYRHSKLTNFWAYGICPHLSEFIHNSTVTQLFSVRRNHFTFYIHFVLITKSFTLLKLNPCF
jgi:hypothetical protein